MLLFLPFFYLKASVFLSLVPLSVFTFSALKFFSLSPTWPPMAICQPAQEQIHHLTVSCVRKIFCCFCACLCGFSNKKVATYLFSWYITSSLWHASSIEILDVDYWCLETGKGDDSLLNSLKNIACVNHNMSQSIQRCFNLILRFEVTKRNKRKRKLREELKKQNQKTPTPPYFLVKSLYYWL